jgi:assimilatory nitrate reductase catalytic subunit
VDGRDQPGHDEMSMVGGRSCAVTGIRTTCPYCGVGCGLIARPDGKVVGDPEHPANFGRLCSKGAALAETLGLENRLLYPNIGGRRAGWDETLDLIADRFRAAIDQHGPDSVAFYVSGQCLTEDYYVANKLMKGLIGSGNIDTNSRLCMASSVAGHTRAFGADIVPGTYEDLEDADLVVLTGSNLAWCHPVLHQRLLAARARRGTRIVVIDPRRTDSCDAADLHLALAPGSDVALFNGLFAALADRGALDRRWIDAHATGFDETLAAARADDPAATGLDPADLARVYDWFATTERTVTVYSQGVNQSSAGTDKVNAIINCHLATGRIGKPGAGPFSITGQPNAMGGREVGGLANQLAAHMRFEPTDLDRVRRFWQAPSLATRPGLKAVELFDAVAAGRIKALWIMATNPADSMPRAGQVRAALEACPFVVVSDCWPTDTTALADVVLPAAGWGEKDGTVTNAERRISRQRGFRPMPGETKPDWWALAELGKRLGWPEHFAWQSAGEIFREHAALSAFENEGARIFNLAGLTDLDYEAMVPQQWPVPAQGAPGGRLFAAGGFPTPDGRARFVPVSWRPPAARGRLLLNTGRIRDQWHTMTRTGLVPRLLAHRDAPLLALAPTDAAALGVAEGGLARLRSAQGETILRVAIEPAQPPGHVFVPMHWTDQFSGAGPIGKLLSGPVDPISGQPELKAEAVEIAALPTRWRAILVHRWPVRPPQDCHWARVPLAEGHGFELAGWTGLADHAAVTALADTLLDAPPGAERLELADTGRRLWRFASLVEGRLDAFLMVTSAAGTALPDRAALGPLLGESITDATRPGLLAGKLTAAASGGRIVCSCFSVGIDTLTRAIRDQGLADTAAIGAACRAGTNCGSCLPELRAILRGIGQAVVEA